ncbi:hypothetical protein MLD38_039752 [Melastoma candidum]|uniref:Uncharacterized protein n=1 Tax=Melastoma candidum TaxID=119954 RepID=A0ACB9L487_9MYRT|nr:hypothetical protein MLD38_039752 [Melastoma candidum]
MSGSSSVEDGPFVWFPALVLCLFMVLCLCLGPFSLFNAGLARRLVPYRHATLTPSTSSLPDGPDNPSSNLNMVAGLVTPHELTKKSSSDRIEEDLAEARAMIREAIRTRNYTSDRDEVFVPRGRVYRNPYAFHQSHIEMIKRFKIWTYREGERPLVHNGPMKDIYGIEGQFIGEIESPGCPFSAPTPDEAHAFFIPVSITNIVQYIYEPYMMSNKSKIIHTFSDYVKVVADKHPYWRGSNGADHFMVSCHDWAPLVSEADPNMFGNFIRVLCNANKTEGFDPRRDVPLPEFKVPPRTIDVVDTGRPLDERNILAFFAGGAHGYIRKLVLNQWKDRDDDVQVHEYLPPGGEGYMQLMGRARFCLCPSGYEVASPRIVEAIGVGCIPVIISDGYALPFEDVLDWAKFSVRIHVGRIRDIKTILQAIPREKYLRLQKGVMAVKRHFTLNRPAKPYDMFHMVLHSIWLRRLNVGLGGLQV